MEIKLSKTDRKYSQDNGFLEKQEETVLTEKVERISLPFFSSLFFNL